MKCSIGRLLFFLNVLFVCLLLFINFSEFDVLLHLMRYFHTFCISVDSGFILKETII